MRRIFFLLPALFFMSLASSRAAEPITATTNPNFDRIKALVGSWEGTHKTDKGEEKIPLTYELTSGGTAVVEKLSPGQEHEMTTVYFIDGKDVAMTHYCMVGNQPTMKLKKSDGKTLSFDFVRATNLKSPNDPHMHSLKLTTADADHLTQEWSFYEGGKKVGDKEIFAFKRVK